MARALEQALGISVVDEQFLPPLPTKEPSDGGSTSSKGVSTLKFPTSSDSSLSKTPTTPSQMLPPIKTEPAAKDWKSRLPLIAAGAVILVIIGVLALWSTGGFGGEGTPTVTGVGVAQGGSQTAARTRNGVVGETEEVTDEGTTPEVVVPDDTEDASAEPTEEVETPRATVEDTEEPTNTRTQTPSRTATRTPSRTPTRTQVGPTLVSVAEGDEGVVALVYDDDTLILVNRSDINVDVSGLQFVQTTASGSQLSFRSDQWENGTRPVWSLTPGDCFQIWQLELPEQPVPDFCGFRHAWRSVASPRWFWLSSDPSATFEVRRGTTVLATCPVNEGECEVDLTEPTTEGG